MPLRYTEYQGSNLISSTPQTPPTANQEPPGMAQSRRLSRTREYHPVHTQVGNQPGLPFVVSYGIHPPIHPHFLFPGPVRSIHHDALATSTDIIQVSVPSPSPQSRHVSEGGDSTGIGASPLGPGRWMPTKLQTTESRQPPVTSDRLLLTLWNLNPNRCLPGHSQDQ
ncbi:hypothetical protein CSIM01_01729 [Colletotrichum simmondsii]|uniref:Uncharacterized protein n=1 Tax=Colletotrichum simmondsii TaxID=703756 RepID=A0A135T4E0_9PEZI|nr:hypothetical protein CSIM01_01729 [Colletotrichum simmondsii]